MPHIRALAAGHRAPRVNKLPPGSSRARYAPAGSSKRIPQNSRKSTRRYNWVLYIAAMRCSCGVSTCRGEPGAARGCGSAHGRAPLSPDAAPQCPSGIPCRQTTCRCKPHSPPFQLTRPSNSTNVLLQLPPQTRHGLAAAGQVQRRTPDCDRADAAPLCKPVLEDALHGRSVDAVHSHSAVLAGRGDFEAVHAECLSRNTRTAVNQHASP